MSVNSRVLQIAHRTRFLHFAAALSFAVVAAAACGDSDSGDDGLAVTRDVVSHETTQDILVFAPDADGSWPVVIALHGVGGTGEGMAELATQLAREGHVVFAPTYRTNLGTPEGLAESALDVVCSYRFARSIAAEHGGDLDQPVTVVGHSLGAIFALQGGLSDADDADEAVPCFSEVPNPDVIAAISGCYYEFEGAPVDLLDPTGWGNEDAEVVLVAGEDDATCAAWQSEDAATAIRSVGDEVELIVLEGADHLAPIFLHEVDGETVVVPDDPAGERTVEVILDAIGARQDRM